MATIPHLPPGRAGRAWLVHRLAVASRAAELLDQKARVLRQKAGQLSLLAERTEANWTQSCHEADTWSLRANLLGGQAALRTAADPQSAEVSVTWETTMGVPYPARTQCRLPAAVHDSTWSPAAEGAVAAHRGALEAGVEHAAALAALRAVEAELSVTRRRLRGVSHRWHPRLESAHAALLLSLEESERAEGVGLRWALGPPDQTGPRPPGPPQAPPATASGTADR
jgi:V/A-type H+-transporting ATPase subunit D